MQAAAEDLLALGPFGLQLTPGCAPTARFDKWLAERMIAVRSHHGFSFSALRRRVWDEDGTLLSRDHSVHPPKTGTPAAERFWDSATKYCDDGVAFECMYPGYLLGCGADVERAMDLRLRLCVDTSHVFIQVTQDTMAEKSRRRLFDYDLIEEVHISANDGRADQHRPIDITTYELSWALTRLGEGMHTIYESYLHRLSVDDRRRQVEFLLQAMP